jgi:hypothetical protein
LDERIRNDIHIQKLKTLGCDNKFLYLCKYVKHTTWFSFNQQIQDFHVAKSVVDIGFYAGFVGEKIPIEFL